TALGLVDAFRLVEQPERSFSWWDYRMLAFRRNFGLRIDHILVSEPLRTACRSCVVDNTPRLLERPSDHAPVVLEVEAGRAMPDASRLAARYPVLDALPPAARARLEATARWMRVPAGQLLFDDHQACEGFPFVLEG